MPPKKPKPAERQLVRLDLDPDMHQEVRMAAARRRQSMAQFARDAVTELAKKVNAKDGGK